MRHGILIVGLVLVVIHSGVFAATEGTELFSDSFQSPKISSAWTVREGNWAIENGALVNKDGGLITLANTPGARFIMELEITFPSNWMSVILFFAEPENYGTFYFANGYWESFEVDGKR